MKADILRRAAVLGAAGKMGRGISLLLLQEMAKKDVDQSTGQFKGNYTLILIDSNESALRGLKRELKSQMRRFAEQGINQLRAQFANNPKLVSNEEIIEEFVNGALDLARFDTEVVSAKDASAVFEAIVESVSVKAKVFSAIEGASTTKPFYFSNTSSIPIGALSEASGIFGRIIGFHFYNPPPVQRLMEVIPAENTTPQVIDAAKEVAARLGKIVVFSKDVAGFIGNGHFVREIDFALKKVKELERGHSRTEAIWIVNRVTQDFLVRPMGIFQLLDYVGLDVGEKIFGIMSSYLHISFERELIDRLLSEKIAGGQNVDGTQKSGIFEYEGGKIKRIWDGKAYVPLPKDFVGAPPDGFLPWKALHKSKEKERVLENYFKNLFSTQGLGASLAKEFLFNSRDIARKLVADGVAKSVEDVNTVLLNGFYHLYGADCALIPEEANAKGAR